MKAFQIGALILTLLFSGCSAAKPATAENLPPQAQPKATETPQAAEAALGAGFRYSTYGPPSDPGPQYWLSTGQRMSAKFPGSHPEAIWIVSNFLDNGKTSLSFKANSDDPNITSGNSDLNDAPLTLFDEQGLKVWLQVEPGNADMLTLIDLVLNQYKHHPCVIGFGVDVEWYKSDGSAEGTPVSDAEAKAWVKAIRAHNPAYRLFLKHWDPAWMPPTSREGIVFINDSQQFPSFESLDDEFAAWGARFAPAGVGYQYGYPADRAWWSKLEDPAAEIGDAILGRSPNTVSLFWVDFTVLEVFPPEE
ncbi:MAG: hypothetical protein CVU44_07420 [Chloroflexi bacterium HGW-Chloroflexi-6]|nr:MAG: hypothetical protein CVU44_07420 [Chloroflexi bacterium HGW-Chloroflexi-6]